MSSSPTVTAALPLLPIKPLDGESGYLRWKESVLLRLHTLGLAHVLSEEEERPAGGEKQRARDDALCRGHILATLSDRLLPAYAHHATAGDVWRAVGLTYDLEMERVRSWNKARELRYDEGKPLLEQLALLQALDTVGENLDCMAVHLSMGGFPSEFVGKVENSKHGSAPPMDEIWRIARKQELLNRHRLREKKRQLEIDASPPLKRGRRQGE